MERLRTRSGAQLAAVLAAACGAALLLRFPPERYGFWPACPFYALTGLQCPGCGATRALAALLRGNLVEAARFNALALGMLPVLMVAWRRGISRTGWAAVSLLALVFGVWRNL